VTIPTSSQDALSEYDALVVSGRSEDRRFGFAAEVSLFKRSIAPDPEQEDINC
jgi:hypothetical protein